MNKIVISVLMSLIILTSSINSLASSSNVIEKNILFNGLPIEYVLIDDHIHIKADNLMEYGYMKLSSTAYMQTNSKIIHPIVKQSYYCGTIEKPWTKAGITINGMIIETKLIDDVHYCLLDDILSFYFLSNNNPVVNPVRSSLSITYENNFFYHDTHKIGYVSNGIPVLSLTYIKKLIGLEGDRKRNRLSWTEYAENEQFCFAITRSDASKTAILEIYWNDTLVHAKVINNSVDMNDSDVFIPLQDMETYLNLELSIEKDAPIKRIYKFQDIQRLEDTQGDWIFYRTLSNGLAIRNLLTGEKRILVKNGYEKYINTLDGWVYFDKWGGGIYRIKMDGSQLTGLTSSDVIRMTVDEDGIFFMQSRRGEVGDFYRANLDGSHLTKIIDDLDKDIHFAYQIQGNHILYRKKDGIYQINKDGSNKIVIEEFETKYDFHGFPNQSIQYSQEEQLIDGVNTCRVMQTNHATQEVKHIIDIPNPTGQFINLSFTENAVYYTITEEFGMLYHVEINHNK